MRHLLLPALVACSTLLWSGTVAAQSGRAGTATGTTGGAGSVRGVVGSPGALPRGGVQIPSARRPVAPPLHAVPGLGHGVHRGLGDGFIYRYGSLRQTPLGVIVGGGTIPLRAPYGAYVRPGVVIGVPPAHYSYGAVSHGAWVSGAPVWSPEQPRVWQPEAARESCAVVVVLDRSSRGWWQEVTLPVAGAENADELQRVLVARLDEGAAFRVRDAAGAWLEIPAPTQVERIVVERCAAADAYSPGARP